MPSIAEPFPSLARRLEPAARRGRRAARVRSCDPPSQWTADWVGARLVETFSVLARLPEEHPRGLATCWPQVAGTCEELFGNREVRAHVWRQWHRPSPPTPAEVSRMEEALAWLGQHLADPDERQALMVWALLRAARLSIRTAERQGLLPLARSQLYRQRDAACLRLAVCLAAIGVALR